MVHRFNVYLLPEFRCVYVECPANPEVGPTAVEWKASIAVEEEVFLRTLLHFNHNLTL